MKKTNKLTDQQLKTKLRKKCVEIAKRLSKERDGYKCIYCGAGKPQKQVHSHHIFHEGSHPHMSADLDNIITLCASHHQSFAGNRYAFSFHGCPTESTEWLKEKMGKKYLELKERSWLSPNCDIYYWKKKKILLEDQLNKIK